MPCVDSMVAWPAGGRRLMRALLAALPLVLAACGPVKKAPEPTPSAPTPAKPGGPAPVQGATSVKSAKGQFIKLPPPETPASWADARQQAARRLVAANPDITYMGKPPDILLAIPVMSIELHADGSIRRIAVMRYPSQARDTVETAMAAIRRAAPFGDVSRLPKPWKFNETFLFNDARHFKPMTLDQR